jgi:hypothetical protein
VIAIDSETAQALIITTASGRLFRPLAPDPSQIDIEDIAHGLSIQPRFNTRQRHYYSMAQHNLLLTKLVPQRLGLAALLDGAAAAYLGQLPVTLKDVLPEIVEIEAMVMASIAQKFSVSGFDDEIILCARLNAAKIELRDLSLQTPQAAPWPVDANPSNPRIEYMSPAEAEYRFLDMFSALTGYSFRKNRPEPAAVTATGRAPARSQQSIRRHC